MTGSFYSALWDYLSPREKQKLSESLSKKNFAVKGFRMNKDMPSKILAPLIAKREKDFLDIVASLYDTSSAVKTELESEFSPDTALKYLALLIRTNENDEQLVLSLIAKNSISKPELIETDQISKDKKKAEEFRKKYLALYKKYEQIQIEYKKIQSKLQSLSLEMSEKDRIINELTSQKEESELIYSHEIESLNRRVEELQKQTENQKLEKERLRKRYVITNKPVGNYPGVVQIGVDNVSKISFIDEEIEEILLVGNSLPFAIKRSLLKIPGLGEKLHSFQTFSELVIYLEDRRKY